MRMVIAVMVMTLLLVIPTLALETEQAIQRFFVTEIALCRLSVNSSQDDAIPVQKLTDVALGLSFEELAYLASQMSTPKLITSEQNRRPALNSRETCSRQVLLIFDKRGGLATIYRESPIFFILSIIF